MLLKDLIVKATLIYKGMDKTLEELKKIPDDQLLNAILNLEKKPSPDLGIQFLVKLFVYIANIQKNSNVPLDLESDIKNFKKEGLKILAPNTWLPSFGSTSHFENEFKEFMTLISQYIDKLVAKKRSINFIEFKDEHFSPTSKIPTKKSYDSDQIFGTVTELQSKIQDLELAVRELKKSESELADLKEKYAELKKQHTSTEELQKQIQNLEQILVESKKTERDFAILKDKLDIMINDDLDATLIHHLIDCITIEVNFEKSYEQFSQLPPSKKEEHHASIIKIYESLSQIFSRLLTRREEVMLPDKNLKETVQKHFTEQKLLYQNHPLIRPSLFLFSSSHTFLLQTPQYKFYLNAKKIIDYLEPEMLCKLPETLSKRELKIYAEIAKHIYIKKTNQLNLSQMSQTFAAL